MEVKLTYEYVKKEIDKLIEPQDKLDRAIELLGIYHTVIDDFNRDVLINAFYERTVSKNTLRVKPYLESVIDSYKKVLEKPEQERNYTISSLAKLLNISNSSIYKLVEKNKICYSKPNGKIIYFSQSDVDKYLAKEKSTAEDDIKREAMKHILFKKN